MGEGLFVCFNTFLTLQHPILPAGCGQDRGLPHYQHLSCSATFADLDPGPDSGVGLEHKLSLLLTSSHKEELCFAGQWDRAHHTPPRLLYISHQSFKRLPRLPRPQQPWPARNLTLHGYVSDEPEAANVPRVGSTQSSQQWRGSTPRVAGEGRERSRGEPGEGSLTDRERLAALLVIIVSIMLLRE